jgi:hypothetical protein
VLLTAAHCVANDSLPEAYFGAAPPNGGTLVPILAAQVHPAFDATTLANDVAMVLLADDPPAGATPWPLPATALDATAVGLPLRLVGFGLTGPSDSSPAEKRTGTAVLASLAATALQLSPSPSQTCSGDSGGPAFATIGGVEVVVGVTSSGDPSCDAGATDMRVDAYASFITPWLQATSEGAAAAGGRCFYPANCAPSAGECAPAVDDPTLSFCDPPCPSGGSCPAGLQCLSGDDGTMACRHPTPSPGAPGARCEAATDCIAGICAYPASGGSAVCTSTCFPGLPGFCASTSSCEPAADDAGSACFSVTADASTASANPHGGCSVASMGAENPGGCRFAILLVTALGGRRSRRLFRRSRQARRFARPAGR